MKQKTFLGSDGAAPLWDSARDYIRVMLRNVEVDAHVGLHPWEQHPQRPTRLLVNVEMFAPAAADLSNSIIDYDPIREAIKTWPARPHTPLLETFAEEVVGLCFDIVWVEACRVSIVKPDIFNEAAGAGVELYRRRPQSSARS